MDERGILVAASVAGALFAATMAFMAWLLSGDFAASASFLWRTALIAAMPLGVLIVIDAVNAVQDATAGHRERRATKRVRVTLEGDRVLAVGCRIMPDGYAVDVDLAQVGAISAGPDDARDGTRTVAFWDADPDLHPSRHWNRLHARNIRAKQLGSVRVDQRLLNDERTLIEALTERADLLGILVDTSLARPTALVS